VSTHGGFSEPSLPEWKGTGKGTGNMEREGGIALSRSSHSVSEEFKQAWTLWLKKQQHNMQGIPMDEATEESQLYSLENFSTDEAIAIVRFSTSRTRCVSLITNGDHKKADLDRRNIIQESNKI
jgi:hypothetical protein